MSIKTTLKRTLHMSKKKDHEQEEGRIHETNAEGEVTPMQTSEQMQQGNTNLDNQKYGEKTVMDEQGRPKTQAGQVPESTTPEQLKGTAVDPVSYSNPAFDASVDADKVGLPAEEQGKEIQHQLKPTNFYKKGDKIIYNGVEFEAVFDGHGDLPPSMWKPV